MKNSFVQNKNGFKDLIKHLQKLNIKDAIIEYKIKRKLDKLKRNREYSLSHLV